MQVLSVPPKCVAFFAFILSVSISLAQNKGPGGVGVTSSSGTLRGWWRADTGVTLSSGAISTWADQSGRGADFTQTTSSHRPTSTTSTNLNNQPVVHYNGSNGQYFNSGISGPGVDNFTLFVVANGTNYQSIFRFQNDGATFVVYPWELGTGKQFILSTDGGTSGIQTGLVNSVNNVGGARYRRNTTNGFQTYRNGAINAQRTSVNVAPPSQPLYSGVYNPGSSEYPTADVGELILYYTALNDAQMVIVQNYLAAKFNVTLGSNDVYTMDNSANGNYDYDVAGIGRVNSSNIHNDAQGTGFVRIHNPASLGDGDYLMWGRDNGAAQATNTSDIPAGMSGRFARTWRASETGEVGNIDIDIDVTGLSDFASMSAQEIVGKLRLLVDLDNDGLFNDQTPIFNASSVGSNVFRFSGVSVIGNGTRFTFGLGQAQTYYSLTTGAWESNATWSLSSDGSTGALPAGVYPTRIDNVVINSGHTITVNSTSDNGFTGMKPDDLDESNVGSFGSSNLAMFYQTGNIIVRGTLIFSGIEAMIGGYTQIQNGGTLTAGSNLVVTGNLQADAGSALTTLDDLVLTGYSTTVINTASTSSDDLIIDHTDATLCGSGTTTLQNGSGSTITYANGGTISQVCSTFTINCTGSGCSGFPAVGTSVMITGGEGPGGVGTITGDSQLKLWFRVDKGVNLTGTSVDGWTNSAGVPALDVSETTTERPTQVPNAVNGFPEISFSGTNRLRTGLTLTSSNFVNNQASSFTVNRADNTTQTSSVYLTDPLEANRFSNHLPWAASVYFDIGPCCNFDGRLEIPGLTGLTNYSIWSFDANPSTGKQLYRNGTSVQSRPNSQSFTNHANYRFNIGGHISGSQGFQGDVTEVIIFNARINQAERIIIENYLSAKYAIGMSANDVYTQDNAGNGNFDYDVAGIGRAADGSSHKDSQGTSIVRIWNPADLDNSEYLLWGHNNATLTTTTLAAGDVDGTIIKERLTRIWRVGETGDVGTINLSFETDQFSTTFIGSNLRLLIDRDGDGFQDNDVTPVTGTFSNNTVIFSGINFQSGDRFTLGNTSSTQILPITLVSFTADARDADVLVKWKTASEINNDHFEVYRSQDTEHWEVVGNRTGAGTTNNENTYDLVDNLPLAGRSYYRLKQVDLDGKYSFSGIAQVEFVYDNSSVWPNPSSGVFNLSASDSYVEVWDIRGQKILSSRIDLSKTGIDITDQPAGVYVLKVYNAESIRVYRVVKK